MACDQGPSKSTQKDAEAWNSMKLSLGKCILAWNIEKTDLWLWVANLNPCVYIYNPICYYDFLNLLLTIKNAVRNYSCSTSLI